MFRENILQLDGEKFAVFPISGKTMRFTHKSCADNQTQLPSLMDYLAERYQQMGVKTIRPSWSWRGIPQSNLIAIIPGSAANNLPVLMADHIDTAFAEDLFYKTGKRVSNPGADDNDSAASTLLMAAYVLRDKMPINDIWLVHLTGEEYPSDGLGARNLITGWLQAKQDIKGLVLMDMIAYHEKNESLLFQINAGESEDSLTLAKYAWEVAQNMEPESGVKAAFRWRYDPFSYLYNTDGDEFSDAGFPVVLINEHLNYYENFGRPCYHEMCDLSDTIDWEYGTSVSKVVIETVAQLAQIQA